MVNERSFGLPWGVQDDRAETRRAWHEEAPARQATPPPSRTSDALANLRPNRAAANESEELRSEEHTSELQERLALDNHFTYLLGPVKMALRPRLITPGQIDRLENYCRGIWADCLTLEKMWKNGELDHMIEIEPEELEIARSQPWTVTAMERFFSHFCIGWYFQLWRP